MDGCILSVKNGSEKIAGGDKVREGTVLTATVTLDPTYILKGWYIGGELLSEINKTEVTFTVDSDMLITVIVADVKGDAGKDGQDGSNGSNGLNGTGIRSAHIDSDGNLIITFTDGVVTNLGKIVGADGKDGKDGADGKDGKDGIGIKGCRIDDDGNLILTLTDNTTLDASNISAISDRVSVSKPLATVAVSVSGTSLLWNIVTVVIAIVRKRK